jgi:hypothetical protein
MTDFFDALREDCTVLLSRALLNKTVFVFGVDGMGQYGVNNTPKHCQIKGIGVEVFATDQLMNIQGLCRIQLDGHDAQVDGFAATDKNLEISLNNLLAAQNIDKACWIWADLDSQGWDYVTIKIDVDKLIAW